MQPMGGALIVYPLPELWVGSVLSWHEAVAELRLEFAQLSELVAPLRATSSLIISCFKSSCIKTLLFLVLALASSLPRSLFGLLFVTLAHDMSVDAAGKRG